MEIRECKEDDFTKILKLLAQLWPDASLDVERLWEVYNRGLDSTSQHYICATVRSRIIGFCSLTVTNNLWQQGYVGHIDELVVDEQYCGQGIGSKLLNRITEIAREKGCRIVELDSEFHREAAHRFYKKKDFEKRAFLFSKPL